MEYLAFGTHLFFLYLVSSLIVFLMILRFLDVNQQNARFYFGLTCGLGPIVISWLLACLLSLFPSHSNIFYLLVIYSIFGVFAIIGYQQWPFLYQVMKAQVLQIKSLNRCILLSIILLFSCIFILKLIVPNFYSDSLDYIHIAKIIAKNRELDIYPMVTTSSYRSMIASWTHPLGYIGIYIWTYLGSPFTNLVMSLEITSFFYTVCLFFSFINLMTKENINVGLWGFLLLISTPLFFFQAYQASIDPIRFYTFFIALNYLNQIFLQEKNQLFPFSNDVFFGFLLAMACFSHSFGILILPMVTLIYLVLSQAPFQSKIRSMFIFLMIPAMIVLPRLWVNYKTFHSMIVDTSPVWGLPTINYDATLNIIRGLGTPFERIYYGVLKGFTKIREFGFSYWILLFGLFVFKKDFKNTIPHFKQVLNSKHLYLMINAMVVMVFYAMVVLSYFLNMNVFIKNDRYMLSIQPFIAILAGYFMSKIADYLSDCKGIPAS